MNYDVSIIGSGPVGLCLAKALSSLDLRICIIDQQNQSSLETPMDDGREVAITHLSKKILIELGTWDLIDQESISLIKEAKVVNGLSPYSLHFNHQETKEETLGYLVPNRLIKAAAYRAISKLNNVDCLTETIAKEFLITEDGVTLNLSNGDTITSDLLVAADGRLSGSRRQMGIPSEVKDFGKTVIVCKMEHEEPHHNVAFECFHYGRTLAVLPMTGNFSSIVITIASDKANEVLNLSDSDFNADIEERFNHRLGNMKVSSEKFSYPLFASHADYFHAERFVLVGDASVGMHPVTAHGFNLGLRGSYNLKKIIEKAINRNSDPFFSKVVLEQYNKQHQLVTRPLYYGTNLIVDLYNSDRLTAKLLRRAALRFGNNFWPVKKLIMNQLTETN